MRSPLLALLLASSLPGADLIEANRDPAVSARQDFWTHANGAWLRRFPLAPDRAVYNSFAWQDDLIKKDLLVINGELLAKPDATADQRRLADFWRSGRTIDWARLYPTRARRRLALPTHSWLPQRL